MSGVLSKVEQATTGNVVDDLCTSLSAFLDAAAELTPAQVDAMLRRDTRPVTRRTLKVNPVFLRAVCEGSWDTPYDVAARRAQRPCRQIAGRLAGWRERRALAAALEEAALAAIASTGPRPVLPEPLVARLSAQWRAASAVPAPRFPLDDGPGQ